MTEFLFTYFTSYSRDVCSWNKVSWYLFAFLTLTSVCISVLCETAGDCVNADDIHPDGGRLLHISDDTSRQAMKSLIRAKPSLLCYLLYYSFKKNFEQAFQLVVKCYIHHFFIIIYTYHRLYGNSKESVINYFSTNPYCGLRNVISTFDYSGMKVFENLCRINSKCVAVSKKKKRF